MSHVTVDGRSTTRGNQGLFIPAVSAHFISSSHGVHYHIDDRPLFDNTHPYVRLVSSTPGAICETKIALYQQARLVTSLIWPGHSFPNDYGNDLSGYSEILNFEYLKP